METELQCPWQEFRPATVSFCEREICSWVVKPAETWSNLGYLIVGIIIFIHAKKHYPLFKWLGVSTMLLSIGSTFFHASGTFMGEFFDVSFMYLISLFCFLLNWYRIREFNKVIFIRSYIALALSSSLILYLVKPIGITLFAIQTIVSVLMEVYLFINKGDKTRYKNFYIFSLLFLVAFSVWILDKTGYWCDPNNHIFNGHSFWHFMTAVCILYLYKFYSQFDFKKLK